jgi:hypothetical protein
MRDKTRNVFKDMMTKLPTTDNIVWCGPLFTVIPYMEWCYEQYESGEFTIEHLAQSMSYLQDILEGNTQMKWKSGVVHLEFSAKSKIKRK